MKSDGFAKLTPEGRVDGEAWLAKRLIDQIDDLGLNQILMFVGPPGCGKSYTDLRLSELVDPSFSVSRVVFPAVDFVRTVADMLYSYRRNAESKSMDPQREVPCLSDSRGLLRRRLVIADGAPVPIGKE